MGSELKAASTGASSVELKAESASSFSQTSVGATALGLLLLGFPASAPMLGGTAPVPFVRLSLSEGASQATEIIPIPTDHQLLVALVELHERVASNQQDLPADARAVLYDSLWQMYD
jgi:hypothetical protein